MSNLFKPMKVGSVTLGNRVVMAPLTRCRADEEWCPLPMAIEYYRQRSCVPGTLLISEATMISKLAMGRECVPGIFTPKQIEAWKPVVEAVHAQGCFIYCQLWHLGRSGRQEIHDRLGSRVLSSSAVPISDEHATPEAMSEADIRDVFGDFVTAARNALAAGFDGVELHGANGYLIDQFTQDTCNRRADGWGGSVERRARFAVEVTRAVADAVGPRRTAIRLSPFSDFQAMLMDDPLPQFEHLVRALKPLGLAYLHLVEPRISGNIESECGGGGADLGSLVRLWDNQSPVVLAGGYAPDSAREAVDERWAGYDVAVAFGRSFIPNPDLVFRLKEGIELVKHDRSKFYTPGRPEGYIDYPFSEQFLAQAG
ncbi:NADH:flavin oxidoreductase/NADH oxidase [Xylariomycetidae sp. FL2044]|nr:NADH:flavin oxidoreductase/NADH oxidase [Xylariomycetidae sp. FL2044]